MNILKSHLSLYFIFGFLYFFSTIMDWNYASYISKPLFLTAIIFYYLTEKKSTVNYYNLSILILFFLSGIINLIEGFDYLIYVLLLNFLAYSMLLLQLIKELTRKRLYKVDKEIYVTIFLSLIFLSCLLYISLFIVFDLSFELYKTILVYDVILIGLVFCSTLVYLSKPNQKNIHLILFALAAIICELFYGIYYFYHKLSFFRFTSVFCYMLSFYFLIHYFLKENDNEIEE